MHHTLLNTFFDVSSYDIHTEIPSQMRKNDEKSSAKPDITNMGGINL